LSPRLTLFTIFVINIAIVSFNFCNVKFVFPGLLMLYIFMPLWWASFGTENDEVWLYGQRGYYVLHMSHAWLMDILHTKRCAPLLMGIIKYLGILNPFLKRKMH
jgi:hypothetical protein